MPVIMTGTGMKGDPDAESRSPVFEILWDVQAADGHDVRMSSPTISDLDNDGTSEIVVLTKRHGIVAINHDGQEYDLSKQLITDIEDPRSSGFYEKDPFNATEVFSSVLARNIQATVRPELIYGGPGGIYCMDHSGQTKWEPDNTSNGHVFSTPTFTDLEGSWTNSAGSYEIVYVKELEDHTTLLEACDYTGELLFSFSISENATGTASTIAAEDIDGDFWLGPYNRKPTNMEERTTELVISTRDAHATAMRVEISGSEYLLDTIFKKTDPGYHSGSPAVGNLDRDKSLEIVVISTDGTSTREDHELKPIARCFDIHGNTQWEYDLPGIPYPFPNSPVIADLGGSFYRTCDGPTDDIEVIITSGTELFVLDGEFGSLEWSYDAGSPIEADPVVADLDKDGLMEVLVLDTDGKLHCLDGDPSDGIDDGVQSPSDGEERDLLWTHSSGKGAGFPTPAVGDLDGDGRVEIVLCLRDGTIRVLSMNHKSSPCGEDWPAYRGDSNRTGWYHYPPLRKFELKISKEGDSFYEDYVPPGGNTSFKALVKDSSIGPFRSDEYVVSFSVASLKGSTDYDVFYDSPSNESGLGENSIKLNRSGTGEMTIRIEVRDDLSHGDSIDLEIKAFMKDEPMIFASRSFRIRIHINVLMTMDFELGNVKDPEDSDQYLPAMTMGADQTETMMISIENLGDLDDTFSLKLSEPSGDWTWFFPETATTTISKTIGSGTMSSSLPSKVIVPISVECKSNIPDPNPGRMKVRLSSRLKNELYPDQPYINSTVLIFAEDIIEIETGLIQDLIVGIPGSVLSTTLDIQYEGTIEEVVVSNRIHTNTGNWIASFDGDVKFQMRTGTIKKLDIEITVPGDANYGDNTIIDIETIVIGWETREISTLEVQAGLVHDFQVKLLDYPPQSLEPGQSSESRVELTNIGNDRIDIGMEILKPASEVNYGFLDGEGDRIEHIEIDPRDHKIIFFRIMVSPDAAPGKMIAWAQFKDRHGLSKRVELEFNIELVSNQTFEPLAGNSANIGPGFTHRFHATLSNNGNGRQTFNLFIGSSYDVVDGSLTRLGMGWRGGFSGVSRTMHPLSTRKIYASKEPLDMGSVSANEHLSFRNGIYFPGTVDDQYLESLTIVLDSNMSVQLNISVMSPHHNGREKIDGYQFFIFSLVEETEDLSFFRYHLEVAYPDLAFHENALYTMKDRLVEPEFLEGRYRLNMVIENEGFISSSPTQVRVELNGVFKGNVDIPSIQPGGRVNRSFLVDIKEGLMVLKMTIDVDNNVFEFKDQYMEDGLNDNNKAVLTARVVEKDDHANSQTLLLILSLSIVGLLLLFVAVFLTKKAASRISLPKRKTPPTRQKEEEISLDDTEVSELESLMGRLGS